MNLLSSLTIRIQTSDLILEIEGPVQVQFRFLFTTKIISQSCNYPATILDLMPQIYTLTAPAHPGLTPPPGGKCRRAHDCLFRVIS